MTDALTIPAWFNGPPTSANGGYTCGRVAELVGSEIVEVSLRSPPPLDTPIEVRRDGDGVTVHDGDTLVAEGAPSELLLDVPEAIPAAEVAAAQQAGRERWSAGHPFPTCVVCGPGREDGLGIFPAALPGRDGIFGATWTPDESLGDGDGLVRPELVWAALDCPTSAPVGNWNSGPAIVLASLTARLGCPVQIGEPHTILSWKLGQDGRKRWGAAALYDSSGVFTCASRALWVELKE
ncbi:MAG: hypothetical protein ABW142_03345 [Thermoleophilaceae bacterium]